MFLNRLQPSPSSPKKAKRSPKNDWENFPQPREDLALEIEDIGGPETKLSCADNRRISAEMEVRRSHSLLEKLSTPLLDVR